MVSWEFLTETAFKTWFRGVYLRKRIHSFPEFLIILSKNSHNQYAVGTNMILIFTD